MKLAIQLLDDHIDQHPKPVELEWEELVDEFRNPPVLDLPPDEINAALKKGLGLRAWIPAHIENGQRGNHNVISLSCLVLDFDNQTSAQWQAVHEKLAAWGIQHFWHSTRKHAPIDGELRYRLVLRLSRNVLNREWEAFWDVMARELCASTNDTKCKDQTRIFYWPVQIPGRPAYEFGEAGELPLDVEAVMSVAEQPADRPEALTAPEQVLRRLNSIAQGTAKTDWAKLGQNTLRHLLDPSKGEYAPPGERDNALFACANFVAKRIPEADAAAVVDACRPGLQLEGCRHADGATFLEKLERALADAREKLRGTDPVKMWQLGREGPYTEEEIGEYLAQLELPSKDYLTRQLLVKNKGDLYCFYLGDYVHVGSPETGELSARQKLELCNWITIRELDKDGAAAPIKFSKLLDKHCLAVDFVTPALHLHTSRIEGRTLWQAVCPRRLDLVPVFDQEIADWLASWADDRMLDWLATAPRLEKATAALFLRGSPGAGKTMLAKGLAAIWGKPPTSMASLGEQWNDAITENPIILADDSVPQRFREDSGLMRELVTADSITLNRKYMNTTKVHGSIRLIFCKNNLDLFSTTESVTRDDVEAICERLLYYHLPAKRAPYFHPNRLAQHILWLEQERSHKVDGSQRLWVAGRDGELHRHMRVASRERSLVCQWLMKFIHEPHRVSQMAGKFFRLGNGELLASPQLVYEKFEVYLPKERQLSLPSISKVMNELGRRKMRGLYSINLQDLSHWGELNSWELSESELATMVDLAADSLASRSN